MSNSQAPSATAQGEVLLAKYLTDSIRSIEQAIRKSAPAGASMGNPPRSLSAPKLDLRPDGRRPATEVLLPRKLPLAHAQAVAAALAATHRDDHGHTLGGGGTARGHSGQVAAAQARLLHPGASGYGSPPPPLLPRSQSGSPVPKPSNAATAAASLPPRPAVVRTAQAIAAALQQQHHHQQQMYGRGPGGGGGGAAGRSTSAPRLEDSAGRVVSSQSPTVHHQQQQQQQQHHHQQHHKNQRHSHPEGQQEGHKAHPFRLEAKSEARVPAVTAAPPLAGLVGRGGVAAAGAVDARSAASVRRSAPSDVGTHASWWRWRPVTDASYPLTAITDRYAQSLSPSEVVKWNDRVARLEAEINQEKERRKQFEEQLKKLQVATSVTQVRSSGGGGGGGDGAKSGGRSKGGGGGSGGAGTAAATVQSLR